MSQRICICGAGTMGSGIAQLAAQSGFSTLLFDVNAAVIAHAKTSIGKHIQTLVEKNKLEASKKDAIWSRLHFSTDIRECVADIVIEAIVENITAKIDLFNELDLVNTKETVFASNTSSLSLTAIADKIIRPERLVGMHFFNPAPVMKLVEVVTSKYSNESSRKIIVELALQMGKTAVLCKDAPGFIVNHVARPYYIEALRLVEEGIADFETIDKLMEASGFRMGPFKLMDMIGNDINYAVSRSIYETMDKPERLKPSPLQEQKVKDQELGRKTGKGYYSYS